MKALTSQEQHAIEHLLKTGYQSAARSLSVLVKQEVSFEILSFVISKLNTTNIVYYPKGEATLVLTDIMGEVGGCSYLILSAQECAAIQAACCPSVHNMPPHSEMGEGILKEVDNILSAAMITQLSEALDLPIYGGVPQLFVQSAATMQREIKKELSPDEGSCHLMVNARFMFDNHPYLQPQFLWKLSPEFLQHLEEYLPSIL